MLKGNKGNKDYNNVFATWFGCYYCVECERELPSIQDDYLAEIEREEKMCIQCIQERDEEIMDALKHPDDRG